MGKLSWCALPSMLESENVTFLSKCLHLRPFFLSDSWDSAWYLLWMELPWGPEFARLPILFSVWALRLPKRKTSGKFLTKMHATLAWCFLLIQALLDTAETSSSLLQIRQTIPWSAVDEPFLAGWGKLLSALLEATPGIRGPVLDPSSMDLEHRAGGRGWASGS